MDHAYFRFKQRRMHVVCLKGLRWNVLKLWIISIQKYEITFLQNNWIISTQNLRKTTSRLILKIIKTLQLTMVIKQKQPSVGEAEAGLIGKGVLKICSKFTWENQNRSVISIKSLCNKVALQLYWNRTSA